MNPDKLRRDEKALDFVRACEVVVDQGQEGPASRLAQSRATRSVSR